MNILHLEDNATDAAFVRDLLAIDWPDLIVHVVSTRSAFLAELARGGHDVIVADFTLAAFTGLEALELARIHATDIPFIFFTGTLGEDRALDAVHEGAADYVLKDHAKRLPTAVRHAVREATERRSRRSAEAANQRLLAIFDHTPDLVAMADPDGRLRYFNRAGLRLIGLPPDTTVTHLTIRDFHPPAVADFILREAILEAMRDGSWTGETSLLTRDGREIPVSQVIVAHKNPDGSTEYLSTIIRDLTTQRRHEAAVRESNERFERVARATNDTIWDLNLNTHELWWSDTFATLYGHPSTGRDTTLADWVRRIHPDDQARVESKFLVAIAEARESWSDEYRFLRTDGTYADVLDRGQIVRDHLGRPSRMIGSLVDLTARKQAERRVRELLDLLDKAPDAIIVSELNGGVTFWNRGAEHLSGWTSSEALGRPIEDLFGPAARDKIAAARSGLDARGDWRGEIPLRNRQGHPIIVEFNATVVCDDNGHPKARLCIVTDITERKKLEDRFLRAQRLESVGMLAAGIAHDLNNVLSPILMGAPMLRDHLTDYGDLKLVAMFETSAQRGAGLVRQILNFAQGVGGELRQVHLKHLVRDIATVVRETFPRNITYEEHVGTALWPVMANPTQVHQVLLNLCVNARDAMPRGGSLRVRAENLVLNDETARQHDGASAGPWVVLHVEDTGVGIVPDVLARIWEPFFTTKESGKGTGLGLSTVRGIVQTHHGFTTVQSTVGLGTTFRVYLPAAVGALGEPIASTPPTLPRGQRELILVVDDEADIREIITTTLTRQGYRVLAARDGAEALTLFTQRGREIRVMITDLNMPRLDGSAVASVVRRLNPAVRIIAASGLGSDGKPGTPAPSFADAFLAKPFSVETLLDSLHRVIHLAPAAAPPTPSSPPSP